MLPAKNRKHLSHNAVKGYPLGSKEFQLLDEAKAGDQPSNWRGVTSNSCHQTFSPSDGSFTLRNLAARKIAPAAIWWGLNCRQSDVLSLQAIFQCVNKAREGRENIELELLKLKRINNSGSYPSFTKFHATWARAFWATLNFFIASTRGLYGWWTLRSKPKVASTTLSPSKISSFCCSYTSWMIDEDQWDN